MGKIGIDFGTTNSTIAYMDDNGLVKAFKYPGETGYEYIPTCIAYDDDGIRVGRNSLDLSASDEARFYKNIKMFLPMSEGERLVAKWPDGKEPEEVATDFLRAVLVDGTYSLAAQQGEVNGIVLGVPHVWRKVLNHTGRIKLQQIIKERVGLTLIQLISEPVAAAAYYTHIKKDFKGSLLVCDVGGGTFDLTLCRIEDNRIIEIHNDGNGFSGFGSAGVHFDENLIMEYSDKQQVPIEKYSAEFNEIYHDLQEKKVLDHDNITKRIMLCLRDPEGMSDTICIKLNEKKFTFEMIRRAFTCVQEEMLNVLGRFKQHLDANGHSIDAFFFVGGFSQFYLVKDLVKGFWQTATHSRRFSDHENDAISRYSIAYGAALVANEVVTVEERTNSSIGILGYRLGNKNTPIQIPIIEQGKRLSDYADFRFALQELHLYKAVAQQYHTPDVKVFVRAASGDTHELSLQAVHKIDLPGLNVQGNYWNAGMRANESGIIYLVFKDKSGKISQEYELGDLINKSSINLLVH